VSPTAGTLSRVDATGAATVIGTGFGNDGFGLAFGPDGRLYVSDFDNDRILVVPEAENAAAGAAALVMLASLRGCSTGLPRRRDDLPAHNERTARG
jgi:sugar lactone lactonase YvrE